MRYLTRFLLGLSVAFFAVQAHAQTLNRIDDWSEAKGWEGVGLLYIGGSATCTGALIRPDLVLTAAHCLYDQRGNRIDPNVIRFLAAWRDGEAISRRTGKHALLHAEYKPTKYPTGEEIYYDLALMQLDMPVSASTAGHFGTGSIGKGTFVSVVSYGAGRNDAASIEKDCKVLQDYGGVLAFNCSVVPGSSGSPVFSLHRNTPRIISVISALGSDGTAYGMDLSQHISGMLADFDAGRGVYPAVVQSQKRISVGNRRTSTGGALFLKP